MSFEKHSRKKQIEKEATQVASKSVNEVVRKIMRSEFEKHYLSLVFYKEGSAQLCLDACSFDEKQDAYLPNMDWILENDADECVIYCCMLNTAYISFKHQQSKVDALTLQVAEMKSRLNDAYTDGQSAMYTARQSKIDELQKQVDAVKQLIEEYRDPPTEDRAFQYALSIVAYELEQVLKGGEV